MSTHVRHQDPYRTDLGRGISPSRGKIFCGHGLGSRDGILFGIGDAKMVQLGVLFLAILGRVNSQHPQPHWKRVYPFSGAISCSCWPIRGER